MELKLTLTEDDLKPLENIIARAMTRALISAARVIARENLFGIVSREPSTEPTVPVKEAFNKIRESFTEQFTAPEPAPPPAPEFPWDIAARKAREKIQSALEPVEEKEQVQPALPISIPEQPRPVLDWQLPKKRAEGKRRSVADVCKRVADRPAGYIMTDEARKIIGGNPDTAAATVQKWVIEREVKAVIVHNERVTPTKGLGGGRLYIEAESLKRRNELRMENAKLAPIERKPAPQVST